MSEQQSLQTQQDPKDNERSFVRRFMTGAFLATAALNLLHGDTSMGKAHEAERESPVLAEATEVANRYTNCRITRFEDLHETPPEDEVPMHTVPRERTTIDFAATYGVDPAAAPALEKYWVDDTVTWDGASIRMEVIEKEGDMPNPMAYGEVTRTPDPTFSERSAMPELVDTTVSAKLYPRTDFSDGTMATFYLNTSATAYLGKETVTTEVDKVCGIARLTDGEWKLELPDGEGLAPHVTSTRQAFPYTSVK